MIYKRKISEVINNYQQNPEGWFYLPNQKNKWNLETEGIFIDDEFGEHEHETQKLIDEGWLETIESSMIEDVIYNANMQKDDLTFQQLFDTLVYFIDNDSFLTF